MPSKLVNGVDSQNVTQGKNSFLAKPLTAELIRKKNIPQTDKKRQNFKTARRHLKHQESIFNATQWQPTQYVWMHCCPKYGIKPLISAQVAVKSQKVTHSI